LYEVREKILVQRSPGPDPNACFDDINLHFTESTVGFVPWSSLSGVRNNSLKKVTRYKGEKPPRPDLPKREELEKRSERFSAKFLLGAMNSSAAKDFLRANRRSNIHLYPDDWKKLPIPDVSPAQQALVVKLVDQILAAKRLDPAADVTALEGQIDTLVNELYGLAPKEGDISRVDKPVGPQCVNLHRHPRGMRFKVTKSPVADLCRKKVPVLRAVIPARVFMDL
jgi:hypothetical protein